VFSTISECLFPISEDQYFMRKGFLKRLMMKEAPTAHIATKAIVPALLHNQKLKMSAIEMEAFGDIDFSEASFCEPNIYVDNVLSNTAISMEHWPRHWIFPYLPSANETESGDFSFFFNVSRARRKGDQKYDGWRVWFVLPPLSQKSSNRVVRLFLACGHHESEFYNVSLIHQITQSKEPVTSHRVWDWSIVKTAPGELRIHQTTANVDPISESEQWLLSRQPGFPNALHFRFPGGEVDTPSKIVYLLDDPVFTAWSVLRRSTTGLLNYCAQSGCLLALALEFVQCFEDVVNSTLIGRGQHSAQENEHQELERLGLYASGGADFLLLMHHFHQWKQYASRHGTQMMVVKATSLPAALPAIAEFVGDKMLVADAREFSTILETRKAESRQRPTHDIEIQDDVRWTKTQQKTQCGIRDPRLFHLSRRIDPYLCSKLELLLGRFRDEYFSLPTVSLFPPQQDPGPPSGLALPSDTVLSDLLEPFDLRDWCSWRPVAAHLTPRSLEPPPIGAEEWIPRDQLERVKGGADHIVVTNANCGFVDLAVNLFVSMERLGHSNLLVFAEDCSAYFSLASVLGPDHVARPLRRPMDLPSDETGNGPSQSHEYKSAGFRVVTFVRPVYLAYLLHKGVSVLWQDADTVTLGQPLALHVPAWASLSVIDDADSVSELDLDADRPRYFCSCLVFLRSCPQSIWLMNRWKSLLKHGRGVMEDQMLFNRALEDLGNPLVFRGGGLPIAFNGTSEEEDEKASKVSRWRAVILPSQNFPNGQHWDMHRTTAAWAHANYRMGKDSKIEFLKERGLWHLLHRVDDANTLHPLERCLTWARAETRE